MHMKVRACELSGGCSTDGSSFSYYFIGREGYASLSQPPTSWITTGGTLRIQSGFRMCIAGHRLFHTNQKLMTFLRRLKVSCMQSTSHLPSLVLSRLVCVVPMCVFLSRGAKMVFSSMPTFHSIPFVPVYFARAGTSPAYAQHLSLASRGSTRAGLLLSSRDIQPSCAPSTC